jgi:putative protease
MAKPIGKITHYYDKAMVGVVALSGKLSLGDKITVKKGEEEFEMTIESMQIDHKPVKSAKKGEEAAIKLGQPAKEGAEIYPAE